MKHSIHDTIARIISSIGFPVALGVAGAVVFAITNPDPPAETFRKMIVAAAFAVIVGGLFVTVTRATLIAVCRRRIRARSQTTPR